VEPRVAASPLTGSRIKSAARTCGFDLCGIAPAESLPELSFLDRWLSQGYAGEMSYLARTARRRSDVRAVLPSARSVIVTAVNYNTDRPYSVECADANRAQIARYAWGDDYHDVIGERHERLLAWMRGASPEPFEALAYVDTGPVQERVYARHAGIGWIGKNTCVINPEIGSWLFLGVIICSLPLEPDTASFDQCGSCTLCLEACPTAAFVAPGVMDATRCISYLTIEQRGPIPERLADQVGSHVYGCDVCQEVCPWNQTAPRSTDSAWQPRPIWDQPPLASLIARTDAELNEGLQGSAMRRTKTAGLRRNLAVAQANLEHESSPGATSRGR
jgi:epoxyqueuosine reductase